MVISIECGVIEHGDHVHVDLFDSASLFSATLFKRSVEACAFVALPLTLPPSLDLERLSSCGTDCTVDLVEAVYNPRCLQGIYRFLSEMLKSHLRTRRRRCGSSPYCIRSSDQL